MADTPELERAQKQAIHNSIEHLYGPDSVDLRNDELIVLAQVRNSRPYVKAFVEHYSSMGVKHMVFLDNGSTDGTVEALKEYDNVTVLRTTLPFRTHNVAMRQYLIERFGRRRWSLLVDVDELFDYPFSDVVGLGTLLRYLNENRYTAMVAHMLDMFSEVPISRDSSLSLPEHEPLKRSTASTMFPTFAGRVTAGLAKRTMWHRTRISRYCVAESGKPSSITMHC